MWQRMEQSHWLLDGKKDGRSLSTSSPIRSAHIVNSSGAGAPVGRFWQSTVENIVGWGIKPESPATAAAILASKDPAKPGKNMKPLVASLS